MAREQFGLEHPGIQTQVLRPKPIISVDEEPRLMIICLRASSNGDRESVGHTPFLPMLLNFRNGSKAVMQAASAQ